LAVFAAGTVQAQDLTFKDKDAFGAAVREYLLENPAVIFEAVDKHRAEQEKMEKASAESKIEEHAAFLTSKDAPFIGNPNADITIVEFFDYNCGYCKRALTDIQALVKEDSNIRVVFKEMAILGPTSKTAALWSLAAHKQGKYFDFHVALMQHSGPKNESELEKLAAKVGLDVEKMKADANSKEIADQFDKDMQISREIGAQGTPAFIIGTQFIPGYIGEDGLKAVVAEEREKLQKDG